jgi:hypothetical protein
MCKSWRRLLGEFFVLYSHRNFLNFSHISLAASNRLCLLLLPALPEPGAGSREKSGVERGASTPGRLGYIGKQLMLRIGLDRIVFRVLKIRTDVFIEA